MALPALNMEWELPVEQRLTKLEADVAHLQSDVTEMKSSIQRLDTKIDGVKDTIAALALSTERSIAEVRLLIDKSNSYLMRWGITLYIGLVAGLVTAFMWIAERLPAVQ